MKYQVLFIIVNLATSANAGDFDYFIFTQIYPTSVCRADNDKVPDTCLIPKNTSPWTIHGLWPSINDHSIHYDFCKGEAFNTSSIAQFKDRLNVNWPNLFPDASDYSLWKHEWEKHGRCSVNITELSTQERYFNYTLLLHDGFSVYRALDSHGIIPKSNVTYTLNDLTEALNSAFGPQSTKIYCLRDKKAKRWLLADIRLCLNKKFEVIQCPKGEALLRNPCPLPESQLCPAAGIHYIEPEQNLKSWCHNPVDNSLFFIFCGDNLDALAYNVIDDM